jgi:hypothetical protein
MRVGTACGRLINQSQAPAEKANQESAESAQDYGKQTKNYFINHVSIIPFAAGPVTSAIFFLIDSQAN